MWKHFIPYQTLTMLWYSRISRNISFLPNLAASVRGVSPKLFLMNESPRILCFLCVAWRNMSCNERILDQYDKIVLHTFVGDFSPSESELTVYRDRTNTVYSFNVKERKIASKVLLQVQEENEWKSPETEIEGASWQRLSNVLTGSGARRGIAN